MENELNDSPLLRNLKRQRPEAGSQEPPAGYFDSFAARLHDAIGDETVLEAEAPLLHSLPKTQPVPDEAYFQAFPDRITDAAILSDAPMLTSIPKRLPAVPAGYFEAVPALVQARIAPATGGGRLRQLAFSPAFRYAVAAAVALLLTVGAYVWLRPAPTNSLIGGNEPVAGIVPAPETPTPAPVLSLATEAALARPQTTAQALRALSHEELMAVVEEHTTSAQQVIDVVGEEALADITTASDLIQSMNPDDVMDLLDGLSPEDLL